MYLGTRGDDGGNSRKHTRRFRFHLAYPFILLQHRTPCHLYFRRLFIFTSPRCANNIPTSGQCSTTRCAIMDIVSLPKYTRAVSIKYRAYLAEIIVAGVVSPLRKNITSWPIINYYCPLVLLLVANNFEHLSYKVIAPE